MANEYTHLKILDVRERKDTSTGELRIYADCVEIQPRAYSINLTRQPADFINQCRNVKGKEVMFPTREGTMNDRSFVAVGEGVLMMATTPPPSVIPTANK